MMMMMMMMIYVVHLRIYYAEETDLEISINIQVLSTLNRKRWFLYVGSLSVCLSVCMDGRTDGWESR
jgi:hypothetical protein